MDRSGNGCLDLGSSADDERRTDEERGEISSRPSRRAGGGLFLLGGFEKKFV